MVAFFLSSCSGLAMASTCVQIDLKRLGLRLSQDLGRTVGAGEVHAWLNGRGLKHAGDWWSCESDGAMGNLQCDEILHVRNHVTNSGVTFIEDGESPRE